MFENFDPDDLAAGEQRSGVTARSSTAPVQPTTGGVEDPVDALDEGLREEEQRYAILRLGTAVGSLPQGQAADLPDPNVVNTRTSRELEGFAAGLGEFQNTGAIGVTLVDAGIPVPALKPIIESEPLAPNLLIATRPTPTGSRRPCGSSGSTPRRSR